MRILRKLAIAILVFIGIESVHAQTTINPNQIRSNWGGQTLTWTNGALNLAGINLVTPDIFNYTVAGLPAAGDLGRVAIVTDGTSKTDCTVGGGSTFVFCMDTGSVWTPASGGVGSGSVTSVGLVGTANQLTVTGTSPITTSGSWTISIPTNPTLPGTTTGTFSGNLTGNVTGNASGTAATITGLLVVANTPLTTTQDILYRNGAALARLPIVADGTCLGATAGAWASLSCSGSSSFTSLTGGTNSAAAMIVGTGASLTVSGSGTINSTTLGGATFANPGVIGTTPAVGHFTTLDTTAGFTAGTQIISPIFLSNAADPADTGIIRLGNGETICAEASPAGTDPCISVTTLEEWDVNTGFRSPYYRSNGTNTAAAGILRLASTEIIGWRNNANSADIQISKTGAANGSVPADTITTNGNGMLVSGPLLLQNGTAQSATGDMRLQSTGSIGWRNNAGSGDILVTKSATDQIVLPSANVTSLTASRCVETDASKNLVSAAAVCGSGGGTPSFPITVTGTTTSGGIPYFSSTTVESSSGILNTNILVKGGGAGGAPTNSSITDDGTTVSTALPISVTSNGTNPGNVSFAGQNTVVTPATNTFNIMGPADADGVFTAYALQFPNAAPAANSIVCTGAPTSAVSQATYCTSVTNLTLVTPALGTPSALVLTNATGLPVGSLTGLGTNVGTFLATPTTANFAAAVTGETGTGAVVFATSPALVTPDLGTPSAGVLTSATGLPISTGVSGLGTGVATFLATPSSANLISAVTNETGSGALVFATSPALVTPDLGTPSAGVLTSATGLPISTGVSGLGTGVATFLGTPTTANFAAAVTGETGTGAVVFATSPALVTPALGTPASGVLTNATGLPLSGVVSPTGAVAAFADGDNAIAFNSASTTSGRVAFTIGETTASTSASTAQLLRVATSNTSTAVPATIVQGTGVAATDNVLALSVTGGVGGANAGATSPGKLGGGITLITGAGSNAGATSGTGGAGGDITLTAGAGGTAAVGSTTGAGGNVILTPGAAGGTGTAGKIGTVQVNGANAGFTYLSQGAANTTTNTNIPANSIIDQAPAAVTAYAVTRPGVAAQGIQTNRMTSAVVTQGFSGDSSHSTTVTTGSGTSVGSTSLCSTTECPVGLYAVHAYLDITTACGTTGSYTVNLIYTDDVGSKTIPINLDGTGAVPATGVVTTTSTANFGEHIQVIRSTGAASINYSTTAVACGTAGPMVGKLYLAVVPVM